MDNSGKYFSNCDSYDKGDVYTHDYTYDENNHLIKDEYKSEIPIGPDERQIQKSTTEYSEFDENGNPTVQIYVGPGGEKEEYSFERKYDENNNCTEEKWYLNGEYIGKYEKEYNERGLIIKQITNDEEDNPDWYITYEYWG